MSPPDHSALAPAARDVRAVPAVVRGASGSDDDPSWQIEGRAIGSRLALLEEEVLKLRKRYRARELALARMAGAIATLRRANRALNDENGILRQQVAELKERGSAERWPEVRPGRHLVASDG